MAFIGATNPALVTALMQNQPQQPISTGPSRSQLVNQFLQQQSAQRPQRVSSYVQGFANLGSDLVDALMAKEGINDQLQQQKALAQQQQLQRNLLAQSLGVPAGLDEQSMFGVAQLQQQRGGIEQRQREAEQRAQREAEEAAREQRQQQIENQFKREELALKKEEAAAEKIKGTPEYKAAEFEAKEVVKNKLKAPEQVEMINNKMAALQDTLNLVNDIKTHENLADVTGFFDALTPTLSSASRDVEGKIKTLQSRLTLQALKNLKAEGGTLGAVNEKEFSALEKNIANLDTSLGTGAFVEQLNNIESGFNNIISNMQSQKNRILNQSKTDEELLQEIMQ